LFTAVPRCASRRIAEIVAALALASASLAPPAGAQSPDIILGLYSVPVEGCSLVAAAGFTVVHSYEFETSNLDVDEFVRRARDYLDTAERWQLRVLLGLPRAWARAGRDGDLRHAIGALRSHSALLAWYEEEMVPAGDLDVVIRMNRIVVEEDPQHGFVIEESRDRTALLDVGRERMFTWYPVTPSARRKQRLLRLEDRFPVARLEGLGFWPALQAFGRDSIPGYTKRDWLAPTFDELHYCTYAALLAGATGLFYYSYSQPTRYEPERAARKAWPWTTYRPLPEIAPSLWQSTLVCAREARVLLPALAAGTRRNWQPKLPAGVQSGAWETPQGMLVLVTNERYVPVTVEMPVDASRSRELDSTGFGAARDLEAGVLRVPLSGPGARAFLLE